MEFSFSRTFGQHESRQRLCQTLAQGRFPHALLVHGEPGLGQHALLLDLAQILSCESAVELPCGKCYSCKAFQNAALESIHYLIPLLKKETGGDKNPEGDEEGPKSALTELSAAQIEELYGFIRQWHEQPYGFGVSEKSMVRVAQSRELMGRLSYAGDRGRSRIVLVPYFESLNPSSATALLKTLEEPPANVYFLIASENRAALLPTLLSRCMHLGLSPLPPTEFRETAIALSTHVGKPLSERLVPFAEGSPGVYLDLLENGGEDLLEAAARFLSAATALDWRIFSDHAATVEGMEDATRLVLFLLRCVRVHLAMKAKHPDSMGGRANGYRWTLQALTAEGWDSSLVSYLGPLEDIVDLPAFTTYLQTAFQAIKAYSLPRIALLGLFLEYDAKVHK